MTRSFEMGLGSPDQDRYRVHVLWFRAAQRYHRHNPGGEHLLEFVWRSLETEHGQRCAKEVMRLGGFGRWAEQAHPEMGTDPRDEWLTREDLRDIWGITPAKLFGAPVFQNKRQHPPTRRRPRTTEITPAGLCHLWAISSEQVWSRQDVEKALSEKVSTMLMSKGSGIPYIGIGV